MMLMQGCYETPATVKTMSCKSVIHQKGGQCMYRKGLKLFVVSVVAILALTALQQAMNPRYSTIQALVEEHYSGGAEILTVIPFSDGQAVIVNREELSTMGAMYVKPSLLGWKLIGVSSAHFVTGNGLAGYSILPSTDSGGTSGQVMLYGMAKSPISRMDYRTQKTEYRLTVRSGGYFYLILPNGIDQPIEMFAILESGEQLKRPFEI